MSKKWLMQMGCCGQELCENNVPAPQIKLWQHHKLDKLFPFVCHV